jgi:SAM-dependent methyltransferase
MSRLERRAKILQNQGIFLGGPLPAFEISGKKALMTLLNLGLMPQSKVLDIGCGCLRNGYWLIHFLDECSYFGIEPNIEMLNAGLNSIVEKEVIDRKQPKFDNNDRFEFSVFEESFDFYLARSIWTHSSKTQIKTMLDNFLETSNEGAVFLTSYQEPTIFKRDYKGSHWIGKSHTSKTPGIVRHSFRWIRKECSLRGLVAREILEDTFNFGEQIWISIRREQNSNYRESFMVDNHFINKIKYKYLKTFRDKYVRKILRKFGK